ncbi:hypothetical protein EMCRGX_G005271 [Ephydatia muelleri]
MPVLREDPAIKTGPPQPREVVSPGCHVGSVGVRELVLMQEDPREQTRTSAIVKMANRTLRDLRRPQGKVTSQTISTPSPRSGEGIQGTPPPDDSEGVETLDRLIVTRPLAWDRNQTPSTPSTEVAQSLDEARDRDELIVSPLPCTEGNWMSYASYFSPVSPNLMGYSPGPTTGETEGRGVIEPEEEGPHGVRIWRGGQQNWANQRAEVMTPQKAWQRRQREKRQRGQGAESIERPEGPPQAGQRNRTITRMANLQRRYNNSPRQCMDAIRHSPPVLRCEVPIEAVNTYFAAKLAPTQDPLFTQEEVKRILQSMDSRSAPGPDRIKCNTWKYLDPRQEIVTGILNTSRVNGKIPPAWKTSATILIHKGDDPLVLDNWRPIALQNTMYKIYTAIIARRVATWAVVSGTISASQKGFLPMEGCHEHC